MSDRSAQGFCNVVSSGGYVNAIKKKHKKSYTDDRTLVVAVDGDYTAEYDGVIMHWLTTIRQQTVPSQPQTDRKIGVSSQPQLAGSGTSWSDACRAPVVGIELTKPRRCLRHASIGRFEGK